MNRKPTVATEDIEEDAHYVNSVRAVNKTPTTSDQKCRSFTRSFSPVAVCWVILIVIMALRIYFTSVISAETTQRCSLLKENQTSDLLEINRNLTNINRKLDSTVKNLMVQLDKLNKSCAALTINELTGETQDMEVELNVSRAQWSIDQYCPLKRDVRAKCYPCQVGWSQEKSRCYEVTLSLPGYQKTWDEAQADCREKFSDLAVIDNEGEKEAISKMGWSQEVISGYWIGLRVVDGKWKWVDGSDLTKTSWIQPATPTEGHCVISVQNKGLKSVNCGDKNAWICEKKALSIGPVM